MSDMMKMFVEQELQNQIKENYPHMQYPPGLYAKVVSVRQNGELYEAAMIDGANRWKRMWHITLPGIKSTVVTLLILNLGRVMGSNLERLTALENSQVKDFQYQLAVYIYNKGIGAGKFSAATAVGLFQSLIGLILVLLSDKFAKKLGEDGLL